MGYAIVIGERIDGKGNPCANGADVQGFTRPEAPTAPNDVRPHESTRYPSYRVWETFARACGLYAFFYDSQRGVMRRHGCVFRLTSVHVLEVEAALVAYRRKHPNAVPRFTPVEGDTEVTLEDANLARLEWLAFWVRWTVEHCEHPAIGNW